MDVQTVYLELVVEAGGQVGNGMGMRSVLLELRLEAGQQRSEWHGYAICNPRAPTGGGITE